MRMKMRRSWVAASVVALLLVLCGQIIHAIRGQSLTWDEDDHIFAGYQTWKTGDYGLNPEHPPMVKMLATIPLLGLPLKVPPLQGRFFKTEAYLDGRELLFRNSPADGGHYDARTLIFRVRVLPMLFTIFAALLVFAAGVEMFGVSAGLIALFLFCFEPNLLAHGAYVTTDMAASATIFATVYAFWRYLNRQTWQRLLVVGLAAGLALAAKHSTILLAPMLLLLALGELAIGWRKDHRNTNALRIGGALASIVILGVIVLWAFYGFRFNARPAGLTLSPTLAAYVGPLAGVEARGILLAARLHALPESWLYGLADVRAMANGMPSYFFGKVYLHGVWFYFPVLFTIKSTLSMLALLLLTLFAGIKGWLRDLRALWFLCAPPALYLLVAMNSHLNIGARHILPVWVFCCVIAGAGAAALLKQGRGWAIAVGVLLLMHGATTVNAAPDYMAYANEAWGGPGKTYHYLSDSNTDWGQQLVATSDYLRNNNIHDCWFAYFVAPFVLPADYGIPCRLLPTSDTLSISQGYKTPPSISGTVLISAADLNGFEFGSSVLNPYEAFKHQPPVAMIQHGILVFRGTFPVPLASALGHTQASADLLKAKDAEGALREARLAELIAPGEVAVEIALGDALTAAGNKREAAAAYQRALPKINTMDADARTQWTETIQGKQKQLSQ